MAEVNFVDGYPAGYTQATFATNNISALFGETDPQTGVWIPKRYTGTYGTNGFRLSFANNSSTTALGYDSSGQGNNWTPNNFSVTPGVGNDVFVDVPSLYGTDTGLGGEVLGNYCTINTLMQNTSVATISDGALRAATGTSGVSSAYIGTIGFNSGKWYWEVHVEAVGTNNMWIGVTKNQANRTVDAYLNTWTYNKLGQKTDNSATGSTYGATYTSGDIIGVAVDADAGSITFYKNGVSQGIAFTGLSMFGGVYTIAGSDNSATMVFNFGQRPFAYPAPTGYKALCTTNLPAPAIGQTSNNQADNHFNVVTWTGNGSNRTITGVGFQPDLIWIKNRSQGVASTQYAHNLYDTVRGINAGGSPILQTNLTDAEITYSGYGVSAVNADGFSLIGNGSLSNFTGDNYVAWCWNAGGNTVTNSAGTNSATIASTYRANPRAGFSIVTYTGNGTGGATVAHGLGSAPQMMIVRDRNNVNDWVVYHTAIGNGTVLVINNQNGAVAASAGYWNNTTPNSNTFTVGTTSNVNIASRAYLAYCWSAIPGYSAFGSYVGIAGGTNGSFIYTGFRPRFLLIKGNFTTEWLMIDTARNGSNPCNLRIDANSSGAEQTIIYVDILSNGFKLVNSLSYMDNSGSTIIYAAFAETPARLSTAR
jgi:hypothetical protein